MRRTETVDGGVDAFVRNVQASRFYRDKQGVLGLNIGKNADTPIERAAPDVPSE